MSKSRGTYLSDNDRARLDKHDRFLADYYAGQLTYGDGRKTPLYYSLYTPEGRKAAADRFLRSLELEV